MIPNKTIEELILRHSTLEKDLSSGTMDKKLFAEKSKEYSDVNEIIESAKKYILFNNIPTPRTFIGVSIIISAGIYIYIREKTKDHLIATDTPNR